MSALLQSLMLIMASSSCQTRILPFTPALLNGIPAFNRFAMIPGLSVRLSHRRYQRHLRFGLAVSSTLNQPPFEDNDPLKWKKMYDDGRQSVSFGESDGPDLTNDRKSEVRVVSFDLDNTLWKTEETISAANEALYIFMEKDAGLDVSRRVENVMKEIFEANRSKYCPWDASNGQCESEMKSPVLLTQLRQDAIVEICIKYNGFSKANAVDFARDAFQVWTDARHAAIPLHPATSIVECLSHIRELVTSDGHRVLIGAITDGNSDPRKVPELSQLFDFVVNSENVGVAKPNTHVYLTAIKEVMNHPALRSVAAGGLLTNDWIEDTDKKWWVHVGDDFIKDMVAAKDLKMRSIWSTEFVSNERKVNAVAESSDAKGNRTTSGKTVGDLVKELSSMKVAEMTIGTEDFLANSLEIEFVDAKVTRLADVRDVVFSWHAEGLEINASELAKERQASYQQMAELDIPPSVEVQAKMDARHSTVHKNDSPVKGSEAAPKFCVYCGTKIPLIARFCMSCGEEQPQTTVK